MTESKTDTDQHAAELRAALVADLMARGDLRSARWRHAFNTVPRHVFVPRFLLDRDHDGQYVMVNGDDPGQRAEWLRLVYTDEPLVTQLDGDAWVSASSQPSLMARMLEALEVTGSERVLEIGTGTGYNAALLCEGLDAGGQVVSVDIDGGLVEAARTASRTSDTRRRWPRWTALAVTPLPPRMTGSSPPAHCRASPSSGSLRRPTAA